MHVLFLCTGNSCRSIMAEGIFQAMAIQGFTAESAGSHPAGHIHPFALKTLEAHGIASTAFASKSWDDIRTRPDVVITLCDEAAAEACPVFLGNAVRAHWGLPDPAKAKGSEAEIRMVFEEAYVVLRLRLQDFFALPFAEFDEHNAHLAKALEAIGKKHAAR